MIMRTLYESILDNVDLNKNPYKEMFPIPNLKDFKKTKWGDYYIVWECKDIVQAYIGILDVHPVYNKSEFDGIVVIINNDKTIQTSICIIKDGEHYKFAYELAGVGDWVSNSLPDVKKEVLKFFKHLQENPNDIKKIFEYANKAKQDMMSKGFADCKTWNKILGY